MKVEKEKDFLFILSSEKFESEILLPQFNLFSPNTFITPGPGRKQPDPNNIIIRKQPGPRIKSTVLITSSTT
jgi:hypothetical protein